MDIQQSLEVLAQELRRRGLPPAYIARYVAELDDHVNDLIEERRSGMSKDALTDAQVAARIGDPTRLADVASVEFARRTFCGRHPIVMFVLAPMPLAVLAWAATFAAGFALLATIVSVAERLGAGTDSAQAAGMWLAVWIFPTLWVLSITGPPAALTVLLCRLARRNGLGWRWSLAGCVMVALIAGMFQATMDWPAEPGEGRLMLGFGMWFLPPVQQLLQLALPLTIGLGLLWRQTRPRAGLPSPPDVVLERRQAA